MTEKIQKVLAAAGLGSRRQIETWIKASRITVNGKIATIGDRIEGDEKICVDGREIHLSRSQEQKTRVLIYHKDEGEICSRKDPENRPSVFDRLPNLRHGRWISIGRLDYNTSGLLLFTNDGELANRLMHPSAEIEREYASRIQGEVTPMILKRLTRGVQLDDGVARFDEIHDAGGTGSNHWYHVVVREGRNRLVRRLWESQDLRVSRLTRVRFGFITLNRNLKKGRWEDLEAEDIQALKEMVHLRDD